MNRLEAMIARIQTAMGFREDTRLTDRQALIKEREGRFDSLKIELHEGITRIHKTLEGHDGAGN